MVYILYSAHLSPPSYISQKERIEIIMPGIVVIHL